MCDALYLNMIFGLTNFSRYILPDETSYACRLISRHMVARHIYFLRILVTQQTDLIKLERANRARSVCA